ncbi:alpha/beta hydrolase [Shewanella sp. H8]|uniref:alpha/beta hydrolase n=1 Tax=Shewanella sp. H8 TaxID=3342676 RepID=UPI003314DF79
MDSFNKQAPTLEAKQLMAAKLLSLTPLHKLPVTLFRYIFLVMDSVLGLNKIKMDKVINLTVPVSAGDSTIKIRCYYPSAKILPKTLVYFHGGGCVIGSINTHDSFCRYLAKHGKMNIISVGYRLAPEHKFPTPICDAIDAWNYINDHHQLLNINPDHIGVGGDSAGGYLACILGLNSLQTSLSVQAKVKPAFQFLIYPMLDLQGLTESYRSFNKQLILTRDLMDYFRQHYLHSLDEVNLPLVSLLQAKDISESPKSYILTLGYDPLRDDGIAYAQRLKATGINTQHQHFDDCMHGFISITKLSSHAQQATHNIAMALNSFND